MGLNCRLLTGRFWRLPCRSDDGHGYAFKHHETGRPSTDPLQRAADLARSVLTVMGKDGRGKYSSERELKQWLSEEVQFSNEDLGPALSLLSSAGLLIRDDAGLGQPRPGRLPGDDKPAELPETIRLARTVVEVCRPGLPGRGERATRAEIKERLDLADVEISEERLSEIIRRLVDCGQLKQAQRSQAAPINYAVSSSWDYDSVDDLEARVCAVLRGRTEIGYEDEAQLKQWLEADGIGGFSEREFGQALDHLHRIGHLQSPRADHWQGPGPRPTWLVEPVPYIG
jgi:hypothetical protein